MNNEYSQMTDEELRAELARIEADLAQLERRAQLQRSLAAWSWNLLLTGSLAIVTGDTLHKNLAVLRGITARLVMQNAVVIVVVLAACSLLYKRHWAFRWSLWSLLPSDRKGEHATSTPQPNANLTPLHVKWLGLVYGPLLLLSLPELAMFEEKIFREGTTDWVRGIAMSWLFGLAHLGAGVPLAAAFALVVPGLWFTRQYMLGGIELSALHHTAYNVVLLSMMMVGVALRHVPGIKAQRA